MKLTIGAINFKRNSLLLFVLFLTKSALLEKVHSRQKRLLWITTDGRLALPPGTTMVISPSLSLPFVRYPPEGFFSNMTISLPFTIDFNKLGLTDNENPYGVLPPALARSMGRKASNLLIDYVTNYLMHHRRKRDVNYKTREPPKIPDEHKNSFHGGERAFLYIMIEEFLENFGMNGKACLLRAICEVHSYPLNNYGLIGEIIKLFFAASKSPFSEILTEYVQAEMAGRGQKGSPSECWPYLKDCPKSLFQNGHNKYSKNAETETNEIMDENINNGENDITYNTVIQNM